MTVALDAKVAIRVLVVDDSPDHRMLMRRQLETAGMHVTTAATGEQALDRMDGVDLVLLDYRLPRMSGIETLRAINAEGRGPSVVMVTAMGSTDIAVEAMREGAIDYISKNPGYLDALPRIVERAWRHHDLARRATELQRLALLMTSASEREQVMSEIVEGACQLLRASMCVLLLDEGTGRRTVAAVGEHNTHVDELLDRPRDDMPAPGEVEVAVERDDLVVALPVEPGEPLGYLAVFGRESVGATGGEVELAKAFAAFAGTALRNLRRRELESQLIDELQRTIEARHDFVASVSHELRTPLTSIGGYTETLLQRWDSFSEERKQDLLGRVLANSRELSRLIEQLIDVAGLERGQQFTVRLGELDLGPAIGAALEGVEIYTRGRELEVDIEDAVVVADPDLFSRTVANLVSNAVKYSSEDGPIVIRSRIRDDDVRIEVADQGIGLESHEASRVFEPFWRAGSSVTNAIRGSGIGLSLVREYVRTMGGLIGVESEPGVGSTFWFTLPRAGT